MKKYENSIRLLLEQLLKQGEMTLATLNEICNETERKQLIPNAEIFREIMIEFLIAGAIDVAALQKEQKDYLMEASEGFVLNEMLLTILEEKEFQKIAKIRIFPMEEDAHVYFRHIVDENGNFRNFKCSNIGFRYEER